MSLLIILQMIPVLLTHFGRLWFLVPLQTDAALVTGTYRHGSGAHHTMAAHTQDRLSTVATLALPHLSRFSEPRSVPESIAPSAGALWSEPCHIAEPKGLPKILRDEVLIRIDSTSASSCCQTRSFVSPLAASLALSLLALFAWPGCIRIPS